MYSYTNKIDTEIKGYVKGVKSSSIYTIKAVMLYMSEVLNVHTGLPILSFVTHAEGVESSSIYTIRAVMLCMSKVSKVAQYIHYKSCNPMYVKGVERSSKWS